MTNAILVLCTTALLAVDVVGFEPGDDAAGRGLQGVRDGATGESGTWRLASSAWTHPWIVEFTVGEKE